MLMIYLFVALSITDKPADYDNILNDKNNVLLVYSDNLDNSRFLLELLSKNEDSINSWKFIFYTDSVNLMPKELEEYLYAFESLKDSNKINLTRFLWKNDSLFNIDEDLLVFTKYLKKTNNSKTVIRLKELILQDSIIDKNDVYYKLTSINSNLSNSSNVYTYKLGFWFTEYFINNEKNHKFVLKNTYFW